MRKFFTTFGLFLITILSFAQETKYVNTELLNVRSGAGTKYDVIDKVAQGEKITAYSTKGSWTEIELNNGTRGYVSTKFLSDEQNNKKPTGKSKKGNWLYLLLIGGVLLVGLFSKGGSENSSPSKRNEPKLYYWYCRKCGLKVKSEKRPGGHCSIVKGYNSGHNWSKVT